MAAQGFGSIADEGATSKQPRRLRLASLKGQASFSTPLHPPTASQYSRQQAVLQSICCAFSVCTSVIFKISSKHLGALTFMSLPMFGIEFN